MADVTNGFGDFLYNLGKDVLKLVKKQRKEFETTVKTDREAISVFLGSEDSTFSRTATSSQYFR